MNKHANSVVGKGEYSPKPPWKIFWSYTPPRTPAEIFFDENFHFFCVKGCFVPDCNVKIQ